MSIIFFSRINQIRYFIKLFLMITHRNKMIYDIKNDGNTK